jgi:peptidoglycan/xylan/chitin deacetylase (PgdA/CDA1 family)
MIERYLKAAAKRALSSRWGWRAVGPLVRAPGVVVLYYHRVLHRERSDIGGIGFDDFVGHMRWIRAHCDPIHPDELQERARDRRRGRPAVLVTFDDGYRDYHDLAYPVLRELAIPALVFVATSFLDADATPWTDDLQWAVLHSRSDRVRLPWSAPPGVPLNGDASRTILGERAREHLKALPDGERRVALATLLRDLGVVPGRERQMLTWDEVRATMDITTYGGHSHTHPILARLTREDCEREIRVCRDRITAETGWAPRYFAYPNGQPGDFDGETQELLRRHGFTVAFSTSPGVAGPDTDWMAVKRVAGVGAGVADFAWFAATRSRA